MSGPVAFNPKPAGMRISRWLTGLLPGRGFGLAVALSLTGVALVRAQITTISQGSQLPSPQVVGSMADPNSGPRETDPVLERQRIQALRMEREADLISDTNKLLKLTTRLNAEVDETHATSLTHQQLRMLAKIEKLAKSVKRNISTPLPALPSN